MAIHANALAVMAKAPLAGQVKTRLLPVLTELDLVDVVLVLLVDQINQLQELDATDFYLFFAPDEAHLLMTELAPPGFCLLPQQGDDLGARMAAVFAKLFQMGYKNIVLIGGDLPPVPLRYFTEAYAIHGSNSVPTYPASHGCVRVPNWEGDRLVNWLYIGIPVHTWDV